MFLCNVIGFAIFRLSPVIFCWGFRVCFMSTEKWSKKGKYPDGVQIFTFSFENKFFWRQRFPKEIWQMTIWSENVFKGNWCCSFHGQRNFTMETFLGGEHMTSSSSKTAKRINFKLCTRISNRLLHKTVPMFFLIMSHHSFFVAIIRRVLKAYFAWKQLKVDYSKNTWKEENRRHGFVCLLAGYISVKKNYWKVQFCWCRSS